MSESTRAIARVLVMAVIFAVFAWLLG